jgi:hypothetical protein
MCGVFEYGNAGRLDSLNSNQSSLKYLCPSEIMLIPKRFRDLTQAPVIRQKGSNSPDGLALYRRLAIFAGIGSATLALLFECYQYLQSGSYLDHIEGNVIINGWQYLHGAPLYETQDGAPRAATCYGPLAYLVDIPVLWLFGSTVAVSKLTPMLALLGTMVMMSVYFIRNRTWDEAVHSIFFLFAALLLFSPMSFWVRPDPIETLLLAAAVVSTPSRRRSLWVGVCLGLAVNMKVHAFFYFLPILADMWWIGGTRAILAAGAWSAATFCLPFLAPAISVHDYVTELAEQIGGRAQTSAQLPWTMISVALLLLPLAVPLALHRQPPRTILYASATVATVVLLIYPATFPGAGAYHFLPLVPVLADLRHRLLPKGIDAEATILVILLVAWLPMQHTLQALQAQRGSGLVAEEALALARKSGAQPVQVGYGDNRPSYQLSQLSKTVLSLNSYPALLDAQVLMELRQIDIDGSARWIPYLEDCRIREWLLPRREQPFAIVSYFYDEKAVFSEQFRRAFLDNYKLVETGEYFDVWRCAARSR